MDAAFSDSWKWGIIITIIIIKSGGGGGGGGNSDYNVVFAS